MALKAAVANNGWGSSKMRSWKAQGERAPGPPRAGGKLSVPPSQLDQPAKTALDPVNARECPAVDRL